MSSTLHDGHEPPPLAILSGYALRRPLGAGGMGSVWLADRGDRGGRVAVKVLTGYAARHPAFLAAFRAEVRAYAGLAHPCIVGIVDQGVVGVDEASSVAPGLTAGSPYVVMEYLAGGSLAPSCGQLPWREVAAILCSLLDALAHAHARGLVHCDLKPENVLLDRSRTIVKLTDFGLVHALDRTSPGERDKGVAGTPHYMAPEQAEGRWRDYGPWTDMYGLGGLAWALLCGRPPFHALRSPFAVLRAQREQALPPFTPGVPVPERLEAWLTRMLAKDPRQRFSRASEAAAALLALGPAAAPRVSDPRLATEDAEEEQQTDPAIRSPWSVLVTATSLTLGGIPPALGADPQPPAAGVGGGAPPLPSWRGPGGGGPGAPPPGLGLFWLRTLPMVGRERERDRLWTVLSQAVSKRSPQFVTIRGAAGAGASRLARWLAERAHEVGGADVLSAEFGEDPSGSSALRRLVSRRFTLGGLEGDAARSRLRAAFDDLGLPDDAARAGLLALALAEHGASEDTLTGAPPGLLDAALDGLARLLAQLACARPVIVVLDDGEAVPRVRQLVDRLRGCSGAIVVVATGRDDHEAEGPFASLRIGAMEQRDNAAMVRQIMPLEPALALEVEERCAGNPLFARQLVGAWIERGLLAPSPQGFRLPHAGAGTLPDDLHGVWAGRIQDFLRWRAPDDRSAFELMAVWGAELDEDLFGALCGRAGLFPSAELVERLLDDGLTRSGPGGPREGFQLGHAMLRDSLRRQAFEAGRAPDHHRACARTLGTVGGPAASERIARHLLAAGRPAEALGSLLAGVSELVHQGETRRAQSLLADYEGALRQLEVPDGDVAWGRGMLLEVRLAARLGDDAGFAVAADRAEILGARHGWGPIPAYVAFERAVRCRRLGLFEEARRALERGIDWAAEQGDRSLLAQAQTQLASVFRAQGELERAVELLEASVAACVHMGERGLAAHALLGLAEIAARQGDSARKDRRLAEAAALWDGAAEGLGRAATERVQGVAACVDGDLVAGAAFLRSAGARFAPLVPAAATEVEIELGQRLALAGHGGEARIVLEAALLRACSAGDGGQAAAARAGLLACLAEDGGDADDGRDAAADPFAQHAAALALLRADGVGLTADARACLERARRSRRRAAVLSFYEL